MIREATWIATLLATGWLIGTPLYSVWKARRSAARYPPLGQFVEADGVRLHYLRRGDPAACPVVLLHGSDGFLQDFLPDPLDRLAERYDVIAFDRPGHGYSQAPAQNSLTPLAQAELIHAALGQLGVAKPLLVGFSWSGVLLLAYALTFPDEVAGLVLLNGWVYPPETPPFPLLQLPLLPLIGDAITLLGLTPIRARLLGYFLRVAFAPHPVPRDYAKQAQALWQRLPYQTRAFAQENLIAHAAMRGLAPCYGEIRAPVVMVTGAEDRVVDPALHSYRLQTTLPHARLIRAPHSGHEVHRDAPETVLNAVQLCWHLSASADSDRDEECAAADVDPEWLAAREIDPETERARELVFRYGWNATSYQILNPGLTYWFAPEGDAVVGYVRRKGVRIVAGAPVCPVQRLDAVLAAFEAATAQRQERACYFAAASRLYMALCASPLHAILPIGAQPIWNPGNWQAILKQSASLRAQLNRARNKGVEVQEWTPERAGADPDLRRCLAEWLETRGLPTLRFLTEPVALARLGDRRIFVATARQAGNTEEEGVPVGFLLATPVPERNGWLIEQIVRGHAAPNGVAELMVDGVMRTLAAEGADYVTLGLAPLSQRVPQDETLDGPPGLLTRLHLSWLRLLLAWVRAHGRRFYNFEGLDAFKAKFKPDRWEPIYAISNEPHFSLRTLYAIAAAFSSGSPARAIGRTLLAAMRQELAWLRTKPPTKNA
jgi:phosphatidylglycerol lysyltransferase